MPPSRYTIPAPTQGATKTWRKTITGIDPTQTKGYAIQGKFVDAGATYAMDAGGLILGYDEVPGTGNVVTIWHITDTGLAEVKQITRKGPWAGKATINAITKLLGQHPWPVDPAAHGNIPSTIVHTANAANTTSGECRNCHRTVNPGEGTQGRTDRGYRYIEHNTCPPRPPMRNSYAGQCHRCGGWLDVEEGIVVTRKREAIDAVTQMPPSSATFELWRATVNADIEGVTVVHEGDCPPADQRKPVPPRPNRYTEPCALCWKTVPAETGLYRDGAVVHKDTCPAGDDTPTWTIGYGRPGWFNPRPTHGYDHHQVLRADLHEAANPVPVDAPGYRRLRPGVVSAIVVVVTEGKPRYCRDEDGDQPPDLIGTDGWYFKAKARIATAGEAADILAAEAKADNKHVLRMRADMEILRATDRETPDTATGLLNLPGVRVEPRREGSLAFSASYGCYIHLRVDETTGVVWILRYNGADGDDWSANNYTPYVARRVPLTPDRQALLAELRDEFGEL